MMNLLGCLCAIYLTAIVTFAYRGPGVSGPHISITVFDPSGRRSSFVYDGGTAKIKCRCEDCATNQEKLEIHLLPTRKANCSRRALITQGTNSMVTLNINISSSIIAKASNVYRCCVGRLKSPTIQIPYVLCNPLKVKPQRVCPQPKQYCHITESGSAECKRLSKSDCLYGHNTTDARRLNLLLVPHFSTLVKFLAIQSSKCDQEFHLFIRKKNCKEKKQLKMLGWDFVDVANQFTIQGQYSVNQDLVCSCVDSTGAVLMSEEAKLTSHRIFTLAEFGQKLKRLSTPTIANIECNASRNGSLVLQFRTSLMLYNSTRDLKYVVEKKKIHTSGNMMLYNVTIKVIAAPDLYLCVKQLKKRCAPTPPATNQKTLQITVAIPHRETSDSNYTISFYIGLFAASPRKNCVRLFEKTVNYPLQRPLAKRNSSLLMVVLVVAVLVAIIGCAAMIVMMTLWIRQKTLRHRQRIGKSTPGRDPKSKALS